MATRLYYVGDREAVRHYVTGVPARDLTDEDLEAVAADREQTPAAVRDELAGTPAYQKTKPRESEAEAETAPEASRTPRRRREWSAEDTAPEETPEAPPEPASSEPPTPPAEPSRE